MTAKLTKNPSSFTAWSIERNKERRHRRLQSVQAQYKIGGRTVNVGQSEEDSGKSASPYVPLVDPLAHDLVG
jgi:hypothetical protein